MAQHVEVTISNNAIAVNRDPIRMGKLKNQVIEWTIKTAGWTFPDNGIVIDSDTDGQFSESGPIANGRKYKLHNKNSNGKRYKYTVNVTRGGSALSLDPMIMNEN